MIPQGSSLADVTNTAACVKAPDGKPDLTFAFDLQTLVSGLKNAGIPLENGQKVNLVLTGTLKPEFGAKSFSSGQAVLIEGYNLFLPLIHRALP